MRHLTLRTVDCDLEHAQVTRRAGEVRPQLAQVVHEGVRDAVARAQLSQPGTLRGREHALEDRRFRLTVLERCEDRAAVVVRDDHLEVEPCLLYTSPSPRD